MLNNLEKTHGISRIQLVREIVELEVISDLQQQSWNNKIVFYGGTALRLAYGSPRYSEDIDLICRQKTSFGEFKDWIEQLPGKISFPSTVCPSYSTPSKKFLREF